MFKTSLAHSRLLEALDYNPETGIFQWREGCHRRVKPGSRAGGVMPIEYRQIRLDGRFYYEHRLAWFYMTKEWPHEYVDHVNGDKDDNRFCNLRLASNSLNQANGKCKDRNLIGLKGVSRKRDKWIARITKDGVHYSLGCYRTPEEAHAAYCDAAAKTFGEFARAA